jgi:hypothetical protein
MATTEYPEYPDLYTDPQALADMRGTIERIADGTADSLDYELQTAAIFHRFIDQVNSDAIPDAWILRFLAKELTNVLAGAMWEERFPLPGRADVPDHLSKLERRDLQLWEDVVREKGKNGKVTHAITRVAAKRNNSTQTVRNAYYYWSAMFKEDEGKKTD